MRLSESTESDFETHGVMKDILQNELPSDEAAAAEAPLLSKQARSTPPPAARASVLASLRP